MIKSIVFDLGRVLLSFEPWNLVKNLYGNDEKAKMLYNVVFRSETWLNLDRGTIDDEEAVNIMTKACNGYIEEIRYLMENWIEIMTPFEDSIKILKELKNANYNLFLLSNFHKKAYEKVYNKYSFFDNFDGIFISSHYHLIKPEGEIFLKMLQKFSLNPKECLFIDDMPKNVFAAKKLGMEGIIFKNPSALKQELVHLKII